MVALLVPFGRVDLVLDHEVQARRFDDDVQPATVDGCLAGRSCGEQILCEPHCVGRAEDLEDEPVEHSDAEAVTGAGVEQPRDDSRVPDLRTVHPEHPEEVVAAVNPAPGRAQRPPLLLHRVDGALPTREVHRTPGREGAPLVEHDFERRFVHSHRSTVPSRPEATVAHPRVVEGAHTPPPPRKPCVPRPIRRHSAASREETR